jgi:DNA-binding IscR family transcriptional regulator
MISTKGRYALKVMVELAEHDAEEYIPLKGIAEKLNISVRTVEHQIYRTMLELKKIIFIAFFFHFV